MSEQEDMDRLLRGMMASSARPRLSAEFDSRLKKRLRRPRLKPAGRWILAIYAVLALVVSGWAMRSAALDWRVGVIAVVAPVIVVCVVQARQGTRRARGQGV